MERTKLLELDLDVDKMVKKVSETKKSIDELVNSQKELKKQGDTNSKEFIKNEAQLKELRKQYNLGVKAVQVYRMSTGEVQEALDKEVKSLNGAKTNNAELRRIRSELNATTEEGAKAIAEINKKIDENTKFINKNSDGYEKQKQNIGAYTKGINAAKIGSKAFGVVLKTLGIGLIVAGVAKLTEAFGRNQKIMNAVNTVFNAIGIVFDKVVGSIVDAVGAAYDATGGFDALGRIMGNLLTLVLTPLKLSFYGIKLGVQEAQLAWEKSFFGDKDPKTIKELNASIQETKDDLRDVAEQAIKAGIEIKNDFGEAINEVGTLGATVAASTTKAIKSINFKEVVEQAKSLTDARNNTEALIIAQERLILQYQTQAEKLRQVRDDESNSFEERKKANEELGLLLEKQGEAERNLIGLKISAAQQEAALNKGNIEAQNEVLRLKNELYEVEERLTGQRSEKLANDNALRNEELDQIQKFEDKKQELRKQIHEANLEDERAIEEARLEAEFEKQEVELERMTLNEEQKKELLLLLEESKEQELANLKDRYRNDEVEKSIEAENKKIEARRSTLDAIINLAGAENKIGQAALLAKQVLALKEHAISLGLFTSKAALKTSEATVDIAAGTAKSAGAAPFPANIPLIIGFIASVAGIISTIKKAISKGKGSKPKFRDGGFLTIGGNRHSEGGTKFWGEDGTAFEAEKGESMFVLNRKASAALAPMLSDINQQYGGVALSHRSAYLAAGGQVLKNNVNQVSGSNRIDYALQAQMLSDAFRNLPNPVVAVEDINTGQADFAQVVNGADI